MTLRFTVFVFIFLSMAAMPAAATQTAVIPAYACVSASPSSMKAYQRFIDSQNNAAAKKLLRSRKIFLSPRDIKVEVVAVDDNIAKVRLSRLDENARPVTLYFWTPAEQLKLIPPQ
ncbi:hypothetical protein [Desulfosarcina alkanivorans]|nr:hypothetical protein [Desulfosarcina alkanivorans]